MPHINRIRVNNVKYNFGTQAYDDFVMKPFCHNTLYDLANGGGKSVLMLLMLQNVLPNCTLDEKQPVEKLFRTGDGSQTIHSLIEWRLDEEDVINGYQYMTTGFCARKAVQKDSQEEQRKEAASIEYFNYCIFYREYNENDIINLPLVKDKERITYTGLKKYLKELERDNSLIVRIFDVKREYQAFISKYGLYESEWEIIRGINKTEGHVRTYFETNYKTTRKVIEDLLIEEIIQKSFQLKAAIGEEESMSKTLLDIREKLMELSKRKLELSNYDRQMELLTNFSFRLESLLHVYEEMNTCEQDLKKVYVQAIHGAKKTQQSYDQQMLQIEELNASIAGYKKKLEQSKVYQNECKKNLALKEIEQLSKQLESYEKEKNGLSHTLLEKECMNDYLEYLSEKQKRNEATEALKAVQNKNSDLSKEIACYVYFVKKYWDSLTLELSAELEELRKERLQLELAITRDKERELGLEKELAVIDNLLKMTNEKSLELQKIISAKRLDAGILLLEEVPTTIQEVKYRIDVLEKNISIGQLKKKELLEKENAVILGMEKVKFTLSQLEEKQVGEQEFLASYAKDKQRAEQLLKAYGKTEYKELLDEIHYRLRKAIQQIASLRQEYSLIEEELARLKRGEYSLDDSLLLSAKNYLQSRYQVSVMTGIEYLNQQPIDNRSELLSRVTFLPYSLIITQGYEQCYQDLKLYGKEFDQVVIPMINGHAIDTNEISLDNKDMMLVSKDQSLLYDDKRLEQEKSQLHKQLEELSHKINRLEQQEVTYSEDKAYIHIFTTTSLKAYQKITIENQETISRLMQEKEKERMLYQELDLRSKELLALDDDMSSQCKELGLLKERLQLLEELTILMKQVAELSKEEGNYQKKVKHLMEELMACKTALLGDNNKLLQVRQQEDRKRERQLELEQLWENKYKMFYQEGSYKQPNLTMEEMIQKLNGYLQVMQSKYTDLEDKNRLINSYVQAMNRCLKSIENRGMSIANLETLKESDCLRETKEEELKALQSLLKDTNTKYQEVERQLIEKKAIYSRYEGMTEQARKVYEENFGAYVEQPMDEIDIKTFAKEAEQKIAAIQIKEKQVKDGLVELLRTVDQFSFIAKDVERLLRNRVTTIEDTAFEELVVSPLQLLSSFEHLEASWYRNEKEKKAKLEEFILNKQKMNQSLIALNAHGLAQEIEASVRVPQTFEETQTLIQSLLQVNECLELEKNRILSSIKDMQNIKDNFENQCLQRCIHIKTELERLPKLSCITLDNEQIPMISLSIPYVKEEFLKDKMSQYIDEIVNGTDAFLDSQERLKYIRNALSLKKLFSVIVTDMNAIKLSLYKRERIKEQSRHLRYEEAVGSTGQSQGIYTQFLIAIITYISNVNSHRLEDKGLRKVIFIDNPFGAAKDVYIWEPIFELLEQNKVQLIVPARGTTPAITSRFDVNYILGQKLINQRQQTVVVDYHSTVKARETEFTPLKYEQTSFDLYSGS